MSHPYRSPAPSPPPTPATREWPLQRLIREGGYYASPLQADKWTNPVFPFAGRMPPPVEQSQDICEGDKAGFKYSVIRRDDSPISLFKAFLDARMLGVRMATLRELLWLGMKHADWIHTQRCSRLYAAGSFAWHHWEIDNSWTVSIPYLSACSGRVRLQKADKLPEPCDALDEGFVTFLIVYRADR